MTTVNDILIWLDSLAPRELKMHWDNVGLLCGSRHAPVRKVLVALDPFESVCREAAALGADLLLTHHPLIFQAVGAVTDDTALGRSIMLLAGKGISAVCAHTNLDCADGGVNDVLASTLQLQDVQVIGDDHLLRMGTAKEQPLEDFLAHVKDTLNCQGLRYVSGGKSVCKVAVGGGACAGEMADAIAAGCDTFVTSDVKYNQFWQAKEMGLNLIDAGHFHTENPVCPKLAETLQAAFPEIAVILSKNHTDCMNFF